MSASAPQFKTYTVNCWLNRACELHQRHGWKVKGWRCSMLWNPMLCLNSCTWEGCNKGYFGVFPPPKVMGYLDMKVKPTNQSWFPYWKLCETIEKELHKIPIPYIWKTSSCIICSSCCHAWEFLQEPVPNLQRFPICGMDSLRRWGGAVKLFYLWGL